MEYLKKILDDTGIEYTTEKIEKLDRFYELLIKKNEVMNLTAITGYEEVARKHFADSLILMKYYDVNPGDRVLDLGTGGGFPGIPLKIFRPETEFLLVDSVNKKLDFISEVITDLDLKNISVLHGRAEDLARDPEYRESFDLVVSRAVANLSTLSELCLAFVKPGGCFVSYKGSGGREELEAAGNAIQKMSAECHRTEEYELSGGDSRCLIFIEKTGETPMGYPRKAGVPAKKPL